MITMLVNVIYSCEEHQCTSTDESTIFYIVLCIFCLESKHCLSMSLPLSVSLMTYCTCNVRCRNMEEIAIYMEMGFQLVFNLSI